MKKLFAIFTAIFLLATSAHAQVNHTIKGNIKRYQVTEHYLKVKKGEQLKIDLTSHNRFIYFSLFEPNHAQAIFSNMENEHFQGKAKYNGKYKIRVYLVRAAARRNESASYQLNIRQH
ncbi:hypothetical protein ACT2CV_04595 [Pasteurellaceae bacterium 22721_9_1]